MHVIAKRSLVQFYTSHPETRPSLERWYAVVKSARWASMNDVRAAFAKCEVLSGERARFEIAGGNYRLIVAFNFESQIAFVKFLGTHQEYDRVDALTVAQF